MWTLLLCGEKVISWRRKNPCCNETQQIRKNFDITINEHCVLLIEIQFQVVNGPVCFWNLIAMFMMTVTSHFLLPSVVYLVRNLKFRCTMAIARIELHDLITILQQPFDIHIHAWQHCQKVGLLQLLFQMTHFFAHTNSIFAIFSGQFLKTNTWEKHCKNQKVDFVGGNLFISFELMS